jgi:hypothetical protein
MGLDGQHHPPVIFPPKKRFSTHCIGGWVDPTAGLDGCRTSPDHLARSQQNSVSEINDKFHYKNLNKVFFSNATGLQILCILSIQN